MIKPGPLKLMQYKTAVYRATITGLIENFVASPNVWTIVFPR